MAETRNGYVKASVCDSGLTGLNSASIKPDKVVSSALNVSNAAPSETFSLSCSTGSWVFQRRN